MKNKPQGDDADLDKIGNWSVDKLNILKAYSQRYSVIMKSQVYAKTNQRQFHYGYIDGFAGAGKHIHRDTGETIDGSPLNALNLASKFDEYHFIDIDAARVAQLREMSKSTPNATVHQGDCSQVLLKTLFPKFQFKDYRRALCFLDPYGMHLNWEVLATAGAMNSVEVFLNFPVMDINRNAKKKALGSVSAGDRARMTAFWGDESWHAAMYAPSDQQNFLGQLAGDADNAPELEKEDQEAFVAAFQRRLKEVAGFKFVPKPVPMKNSIKAVVYYLFFAGNNPSGNKIVSHIFNEYRKT